MTAWRILEWSRERGRGAITSPHFERVEFDAAVADVDDFTIGETVHVELDGAHDSVRIRRVWPDLPRFRGRAAARAAPPLDGELHAAAEAAIAKASGWTNVRVELSPARVRLLLDDDAFAYGATATLDLLEPSYVELPMEVEARFIRLATTPARGYLATRVEIGASDIAVAIIDDEDRFYFVVARAIAFTRLAREPR